MFSNRRAKAFSFSAGAWHCSPGLVFLFICGLRMSRNCLPWVLGSCVPRVGEFELWLLLPPARHIPCMREFNRLKVGVPSSTHLPDPTKSPS
jgi:hypothetical protein